MEMWLAECLRIRKRRPIKIEIEIEHFMCLMATIKQGLEI